MLRRQIWSFPPVTTFENHFLFPLEKMMKHGEASACCRSFYSYRKINCVCCETKTYCAYSIHSFCKIQGLKGTTQHGDWKEQHNRDIISVKYSFEMRQDSYSMIHILLYSIWKITRCGHSIVAKRDTYQGDSIFIWAGISLGVLLICIYMLQDLS